MMHLAMASGAGGPPPGMSSGAKKSSSPTKAEATIKDDDELEWASKPPPGNMPLGNQQRRVGE